MTIMGKSNSLGGWISPYPKDKTLFNGPGTANCKIDLKKGVYYIRGQGAGGSGGNNGYYANGGGGASGAGFIGHIYIKSNLNLIAAHTGYASQEISAVGENSYIEGIMELRGGNGGGSGDGLSGAGGVFVFCPNASYSSKVSIIDYSVKSNGYQVKNVWTDISGGAHSVLTNNGGGVVGASGQQGRTATMPGAGGAGGIPWDALGGLGKHGDLLIKYIKPKP